MLARDVMTRNVVTVAPDTPVSEIARLLLEKRISGVPVVEPDGRLVGIVSEGDLMRRVEEGGARRGSWWLAMLGIPEERALEYVRTHGRHARDVMTRQVITVSPDTPIGKVARLLEEEHIKRVPVVEDGRLVGIISRADLLRAIASREEAPPATADDRELRERLLRELEAAGLDYHPYVNIVVSDGIVHLWGLVSSKAEAEALRVAAESVEGVRGVDSHLAVLPATAHL
ncbi:MAG TPA: CBS domain-containing protein [Rhodospirillales bacterium]|nr:CBS domain-containing protein [Rhodospirillales bacterium]